MGVGSIVRAQLRRLDALGYLQAPHRAAPPSHRAATRRSGWCAHARNGAAAVSMRGSAPVPLQPRPAVLGRYCRARQRAPALRTPSSDARSRARSVLSRRSGSRDLATASAGTTHRCVHVFVASLPTRPQRLALGLSESTAALRTFGSAAGPHAGTQRIRPNVHASGCSGGRGTCFLPDPTAPPLQLVQSWTSPSPAQLVPPDAFQGAPAKSESVVQRTQLTRQPRSAAVSGTLASLRVTLTLLDRRRARRGDEYAHISTMTSLHRGNCPHLYRD